MLDHRNTLAKDLLSPVQKLMSRRTKTLLPTKEELLRPEIPRNLKKKPEVRQQETRAVLQSKGEISAIFISWRCGACQTTCERTETVEKGDYVAETGCEVIPHQG